MKKDAVIAEVLSTSCLVFTGCAAIVVNDLYGGALGHPGVCLVFGLIVTAMIYCVGNISGARMNPARSLGPALVLGTCLATPTCRWIQGRGCCLDAQQLAGNLN